MSSAISKPFRKLFRLREEMSIGFYITDLIFRKILKQNSNVNWAIHHTSTIRNPENITRGKNVYPGDSPGVYINAFNGVIIGDYTNIGPNVGIISANHNSINNAEQVIEPPIYIGKHCWMGMGAVVLPGVILGDFTIVGAGAVVTKSFPAGYCVIGGNPAGIIKTINKEDCEAVRRVKD